ncbi:MAG: hypothetical protein ACREPP_00015 [Rhodanobacteraceae bacterium]
MTDQVRIDAEHADPVSNVLKWILLIVAWSGWPQLDAVYEHGLAYARSRQFYDTTLFWQWMRLPGDVMFAIGALLMAWGFWVKAGPILPRFLDLRRERAIAAPTME